MCRAFVSHRRSQARQQANTAKQSEITYEGPAENLDVHGHVDSKPSGHSKDGIANHLQCRVDPDREATGQDANDDSAKRKDADKGDSRENAVDIADIGCARDIEAQEAARSITICARAGSVEGVRRRAVAGRAGRAPRVASGAVSASGRPPALSQPG